MGLSWIVNHEHLSSLLTILKQVRYKKQMTGKRERLYTTYGAKLKNNLEYSEKFFCAHAVPELMVVYFQLLRGRLYDGAIKTTAERAYTVNNQLTVDDV